MATPSELLQLLDHRALWLYPLSAAACYVILLLLRRLLRTRLQVLAARTGTDWDDLVVESLASTRTWMLALLALLLAALMQDFGNGIETWVRRGVLALLCLQAGLWTNHGIHAWLEARAAASLAQDDGARATSLAVLGFAARLALWSVVLILVLDQLGFNVTTLVASLGIGGVAVALAVQNILGDLFGSLSIALDKPFVIGDFIVVGEIAGTVEHVGLKTTRIRSLSGEQIVIANADLLGCRIHNYKRMQERRIVFKLGVTYDTPADTLERLPGEIRAAIESQHDTRFDRAHFQGFGASSLDFEIVYYVLTADYNHYMDVQQAINLDIVRRFDRLGVDFAFPTRTVHVASQPATAAG